MPIQEIVIDPAFEGPPASAHGGFVGGILAPHLANDAEITLRRPVPLGTGLRLAARDTGVALYAEDDLVAEGSSTRLADDTPPPPTFAEALDAADSFHGLGSHPYPRCLGCGPDRADVAALRIFPGPVADREIVAGIWYPTGEATVDGALSPRFAWAALDCPGGWAAVHFGGVRGPAVLGRMAARLVPRIEAGPAHIVVGWLVGVSGRKLTTGTALYTSDGIPQGFSRQTWITLAEPGTSR